jgi:hypothetical protein
MRITDRRHHAVHTPEEQATTLMQQLAWQALSCGYFFPRKGMQDKPGAFIQRLDSEKRKLLQHLSSDHFAAGELPGLALVGEVCELGVRGPRSPAS